MKKKIVSTLLCTAMLVTMMAGCGGNNAANTSTNSGNSSSADTGSSDAAATDELRRPKLQLQMRVLPMKEKYLTSTAGTKSSRAVLQIIILDIQRWMQPQVRSVM